MHLRWGTAEPGGASSDLRRRGEVFCADVTPRWHLGTCGATLDLTGLGLLHGEGPTGASRLCRRARESLPVRSAGWGGSPLVARLASWRASSWGEGNLLAIPTGSVPAFLAAFPLSVLRLGKGVQGRLEMLGVHTLGDLQTVPPSLLQAVFGAEGTRLHRTAFGAEDWPGPEPGASVRLALVARASWARPLDSPLASRALRRGLALRGLTWADSLPAGDFRWRLEVVHAGARRRHHQLCAPPPGNLEGWLDFLDRLWRPLLGRRVGLLEVALFGGASPSGREIQLSLFGGAAGPESLARALGRIRRRLDPGLCTAGEMLLQRWGVRWEGEGCGPQGMHSHVDAGGRPR